jgi:hypothetical protein
MKYKEVIGEDGERVLRMFPEVEEIKEQGRLQILVTSERIRRQVINWIPRTNGKT